MSKGRLFEDDEHRKRAEKYAKKGGAYIHCEVDNGITGLCVSGDPKAIVYGCFRTVKRVCELTNLPFEDVVGVIAEMNLCDDRISQEEVD